MKKFLDEVKVTFNKSFVELAFENFEVSYDVRNINLQFLSLMNGLEVLFNPSNRGELRYRISRNLAVLLGKDKEDSSTIYKEMKNLYDKRSDIVHRGKADVNQDDILNLRHYVRESIKMMFKLSKNKSEILELLNSGGFGENTLKI